MQTKTWLYNYPSGLSIPLDYRYNPTFISDMQDLMYSNLYYEYRNHYINEYNEKRIADFINQNKERCDINLLEWLLFDGLFSDGTSSLTQQRLLPEDVEKIKQSILNELTEKLNNCDLIEITSVHTLIRFIVTYNLKDIVKDKLLRYLEEDDEKITAMLQHFTSVGTSSDVGAFYNLYIIDQIVELGLGKEYKERMIQIRNNKNIMKDLQYINYYSGNKEHNFDEKIHIVDKSILLIEKYCTISK